MNTYRLLKRELSHHKKDTYYYYLCNIILKKYVLNCLVLRRKKFSLSFKGKYNSKFTKRIKENISYYIENFFYKMFNKVPMKGKYYFPLPPIHLKLCGNTNEDLLEYILNNLGLEIKKEFLYMCDTKYVISIKNN